MFDPMVVSSGASVVSYSVTPPKLSSIASTGVTSSVSSSFVSSEWVSSFFLLLCCTSGVISWSLLSLGSCSRQFSCDYESWKIFSPGGWVFVPGPVVVLLLDVEFGAVPEIIPALGKKSGVGILFLFLIHPLLQGRRSGPWCCAWYFSHFSLQSSIFRVDVRLWW